jgi:hypothetical protein
MGRSLVFRLSIVLALLFSAFLVFTSNGWGLSYICSTETSDVYQLETDDETWWTLVSQGGTQQVSTNRSGRYIFPKGGVFVWVNIDPLGLADVGEEDCSGDEALQPYENPRNECLGFYAPVEVFYVDGVEYSAGDDGWISFLVPREAVWTWQVVVGDWIAGYQQTETEACHYVGAND